MEELDLKILKGILTDKVNALTFAHRYDHTLFDEDSERFAKLVIDYIKNCLKNKANKNPNPEILTGCVKLEREGFEKYCQQ